jgi:hypothetical protein
MLGGFFLSDGDSKKGSLSVLFQFTVPFAGWYRLGFVYDFEFDRAMKVPVTVTDTTGPHVVYVNQRVVASPDVMLGVFFFTASGSVLVENRGTDQNQTDFNGMSGCLFLGCATERGTLFA